MYEIIARETLPEYEAFLENHPKGHFLQSSLWAAVKASWRWEAVCVRGQDGAIVGGMSVLIRKMPGLPYTLMYSGRGPVCDSGDRETLQALTAGMAELAKRHRA